MDRFFRLVIEAVVSFRMVELHREQGVTGKGQELVAGVDVDDAVPMTKRTLAASNRPVVRMPWGRLGQRTQGALPQTHRALTLLVQPAGQPRQVHQLEEIIVVAA